MSGLVFLAVLLSAVFQASWNFFAKKSSANKAALILIGWMFFGSATVPIVALFTDFSKFTWESVYFIGASGAIHSIYVILLGWAYTIAEISVVYPIARGIGIALTTVFAYLFGFDHISYLGFFGIVTIVLGTILIGLKELPNKEKSKGFWAAILVAMTITSYSLVDSRGAQQIPPLFLIATMNLATVFFAIPILLTKLRKPAIEILRYRKKESVLVASGGSIAYLIILWAFTQAPTSYVVALREFSVVIASCLGVFCLKEDLYKRKVAGILAILIGVILLKIG